MQRMKLAVAVVIPFSLVFIESSIVHCASKEHSSNNDDNLKRNILWKDEDKIRLLKIFYETNTGQKNHKQRLKENWDQTNSQRKEVSAHNLYIRVARWIKKGEAERLLTEQERQCVNLKSFHKKIKWTQKMQDDVLKFYHASDPKKWNQSKRMKELWDKEYPNHPQVTSQHLIVRAKYLQDKRGEEFNMKRRTLTKEQKMDLLRCHYTALKYKGELMEMTRKLFITRYPQYTNATYDILRHQISYFRKQHPEIDQEISREFSASNRLPSSWSLGKTSGSRREESAYIPAFQDHELHRESDQYIGQNYDNSWIHDITGGTFSLGHHNSFAVGTSHQNIHSGHTGELWESKQYHLNESQKESLRGEESSLDLDLHLR